MCVDVCARACVKHRARKMSDFDLSVSKNDENNNDDASIIGGSRLSVTKRVG